RDRPQALADLPRQHQGPGRALPPHGAAPRGGRDRRRRNGVPDDRQELSGVSEAAVLRRLFQNRPELKSPRELSLMREAGKLVAAALRLAREIARPGAKTIDIDQAIADLFKKHNALPLFKGYPGPKVPFPAVTCLSVNEQVVHGIPGPRVLKEGEIIK